MKCPNCGADCTSNSCDLCGTSFCSRKYTVYKKLLHLSHTKWINFLLPVSSIVFLIMTGIILTYSTLNGQPIIFTEWLLLMIFTFIFVIIPFDTVRWLCWGKKKYIEKITDRMKMYKEIEILLAKANRLADTINTTTDKTTFEASLAELKNTFTRLIKYEKYGLFNKTLPSQDLKELFKKEHSARKAFEERLLNAAFTYASTATLRPEINYDTMEGHDFEYYCADLLKKNGFINVAVTQGSGDHGIDILAEKDDISYAIQCKCYSSNIGNAAIQQALAGKKFYKRDIAVVLTNQYFTTQAKEEAEVFGVKLWDRDKLNELIEKSK